MRRTVAALLLCFTLTAGGAMLATTTAQAPVDDAAAPTEIVAAQLDGLPPTVALTAASLVLPPASASHPSLARGTLLVVSTQGRLRLSGETPMIELRDAATRARRTIDLPSGRSALIPSGTRFRFVNRSADPAGFVVVALDPVTERPNTAVRGPDGD